VAAATTLGTPVSPRVTQLGASAVVSWTAPSGATPVDGYVVRRYLGILGAVGAGTVVCQVGSETRSCTDLSLLSGGSSYVVSARRAGWETAAAAVTLTPDTTAPVTSATTAPTPNGRGWITALPVKLTLTATDTPAGGTESSSGVAGISYRVAGGSVMTQGGSTATVTVLQQGSVQVDYWGTDAAGNVESTRSVQLKIDSVAPAAPSSLRISSDTGASATDLVTSTTQQAFTGTAEPGSTVELSYQGAVTSTTTAAVDGTFRIGPQQVAAGSYPMSVHSVDPAGNTSVDVPFTLVVDGTAPVPVVTFPVDDGSYSSTTWPKGCVVAGLCGTASDAGSSVTAVSYELRNVAAGTCWSGSGFTAPACASLRSATGTSSWAVPVTYSALPRNKSLRLSVYADDLAGNRSTVLTRTFQVH
jgi:hypothetical protein